MADGNIRSLPDLRLGIPLVQDFAWLAERMRPDEIAQFLAYSGMSEYVPDIAARTFAMMGGPAFVFVDRQNMPVIAGGFAPVRTGVYDAWMAGTMDGWAKHWRAITKVCRHEMDRLLDADAHRIQICALATRTHAHQWYERGLHMTREGLHKGFCADGTDAVMFARTK